MSEDATISSQALASRDVDPNAVFATISNVKDLIEKIELLIEEDKKNSKGLEPDDCKYYFRGEKKFYGAGKPCPTELKCSLYRTKDVADYERNLYHEAYRLNPDAFVDDHTMVERLTRMQHYSLPTRFADLSASALSALYFACNDALSLSTQTPGDDGVVRVFKVHPKKMKRFTSDIIAAIAHLPLVSENQFKLSGPECRNSMGLDALTYEIQRERPGFSLRGDMRSTLYGEIQQVWAFEPIWNNNRIRFQEGIFLAYGCRDGKKSLDVSFSKDDFPIPDDVTYDKLPPTCGIREVGRIAVERGEKSNVLTELRQYGILEELIYPDLSDSCRSIAKRLSYGIEEPTAKELDEDEDVGSQLDEIVQKIKELTNEVYVVEQNTKTLKFTIKPATKQQEKYAVRKPERNIEFWKGFNDYCKSKKISFWENLGKGTNRSAYFYTGVSTNYNNGTLSLHFSYTKLSTVSLIIYVSSPDLRKSLKDKKNVIEAQLKAKMPGMCSDWQGAKFSDNSGFKRIVFSVDVGAINNETYDKMTTWMGCLIKVLMDEKILNEGCVDSSLRELYK